MAWHRAGLPIVVSPDASPDTDNLFTPEQFAALISSDELVFIDYYAPWCAPCRRMMPMIDSLKVEYHGKVNIVKINADASKDLMKTLGIVSIPYLVLYRNNTLLFSHQGMISRDELTAVFEKFLNKQ